MPSAVDPLFLSFQGAIAGRYSLERELGRGGMGVVYLAREVRLDRPVAVKLLPPAMARDGVLRERFLREARTSAKLSHPNIIPIFAVDEVQDLAEQLGLALEQRKEIPAALRAFVKHNGRLDGAGILFYPFALLFGAGAVGSVFGVGAAFATLIGGLTV